MLGLFPEWPCHTEELQLHPGDLFAIYTDGITEALNQGDEEFGEERLLDVMKRARDLSPSRIVTTVFDEVRRFSGDQQRDDVTLIVARCRSTLVRDLEWLYSIASRTLFRIFIRSAELTAPSVTLVAPQSTVLSCPVVRGMKSTFVSSS